MHSTKLEIVKDWIKSNEHETMRLRLVTLDDAEFILKLRTNSRLNQYLSAVSNNLDSQLSWIERYKEREREGVEFYFIILNGEKAVGTIRMYDFREQSFCWGSWILEPGLSSRVACRSVKHIYNLAFESLGFLGSHFDVRKGNRSVKRFHERMGAVITQEDELNEYFTIDRDSALTSTRDW